MARYTPSYNEVSIDNYQLSLYFKIRYLYTFRYSKLFDVRGLFGNY